MKVSKYCYIALYALSGLLFSAYNMQAQEVKSLSFEELQTRMDNSKAKIQIINFWATWCKPCVKEFPYFEAINNKYQKEEVEILMVSMDFSREKAEEFKDEREVACEIIYLNETDHNKWINKIDPEWSGAIPATLIRSTNSDKRQFYEKQFHEGELEQLVKKFLN